MILKNFIPSLKITFLGLIFLLFFDSSFAIDWYQTYNTKWQNGFSPSPTLAWSETYTLRSYVSMYRASKARNENQTEQNKWLDRIITHCDYIINSTEMENEGRQYLVYAGHGFTPLAMVVKLIFDDDNLYNTYKDKANQYLLYLEQKIVPFWRNYSFDETPFNWFLSYGSLLLYLHQVSNSKYYDSQYYQTPDTTLKNYYLLTVSDITSNYFQDFQNWEYSGVGWNDSPFPLNKGLCYDSINNSYLWRYFDYTGSLNFWGYKSDSTYQGVETDNPFETNKWYKIDLNFNNDSLQMNVFDSSGISLVTQQSTKWDITKTESDLIICKRVDADEFFNGVIDEIKFIKDDKIISNWRLEGNAADSSGNNFNGTIHGTPETVDGKFGKALRFKTGDYIVIPNNSIFDSINKIELWVKFLELNTGRYYILGRGEHFQYGRGGFHLFMDCYKRPEDTGHANLDMEFLTSAANDVHFQNNYSKEKLNRFCNTFTKDIWSNKDTLNPSFRSHIVPTNDYGDSDAEVHTIRWLWLFQNDPLIGTLISNWYEIHPNDQSLSEAVANLACWQAGLKVFDEEITGIIDNSRLSLNELNINVYPNPSSEFITISYSNSEINNLSISIFNTLGIKIKRFSQKELFGHNIINFSTKELPTGLYFCRIDNGINNITKSFIIIK